MKDLNRTTLAGWLVRLPVIYSPRNGTVVASFEVAANDGDKNSLEYEAAFVPCKALGGCTEALENCQLGDKLLVSGRLRTEKREKAAGTQPRLILVCESVHRLKTFSPERTRNGESNRSLESPSAEQISDDEIPF